jgi:hypothetical protein
MAVERITIDWRMDESSRETQRTAVLMKWSDESSGSANSYQRYRYNVETFSESGVIYLHRPAFKNKGCDFVVNCEPQIPRDDGKRYKNPRHRDLTQELLFISNSIPQFKGEIWGSILNVFNCENVANVSPDLCNQVGDTELEWRIERALKVAKWLFIEQDITDWNASGRQMLLDEIQEKLGL